MDNKEMSGGTKGKTRVSIVYFLATPALLFIWVLQKLFNVTVEFRFADPSVPTLAQSNAALGVALNSCHVVIMAMDASLHELPANDDGSRTLDPEDVRHLGDLAESIRRVRRKEGVSPIVLRTSDYNKEMSL